MYLYTYHNPLKNQQIYSDKFPVEKGFKLCHNPIMKPREILPALAVIIGIIGAHGADACTGITLTANDGGVVAARTIEWGESEMENLYTIVPRGYVQQSMLPGGKTRLQRSSAPSRTRAQLRRHGTPFLSSAFFERYAHIVSGFATISSCPVRDNAHHARVYYCARCNAPSRPGASAFALQKCVEPFSLQGSKSAIVHHILPKITFPCRFRRHGVLSVRRFVGTEFCRRRKTRPLFSRILSRDPDSDPCAPSQTAVFAAISGFPACIVSFPVCGRVSKNRRRFRALNAFREVIAATSAHIRSASRSCRLSAFNAKALSSSATLRARVVPPGSPPRKPLSTF